MGSKRTAPLEVTLKSGQITISIGVKTLFRACEEVFDGLVVDNESAFSKEVLRTLKDEEEDGTTLVHRMFDNAIREAIEQGAEGVGDPSDVDDE